MLAEVLPDGTLELNIGPRAPLRLAVNTEDGDEVFNLRHVSGSPDTAEGETIAVTAFDIALEYGGVKRIRGDAGEGDDRITLEEAVLAPAVLLGGPGSDTLQGGSGDDVLLGDTGQVSPGGDVLTEVAAVTGELPLNAAGLPAASEATVQALLDADLVLLVGRSNADGSIDSRALLLELIAGGNDRLWGGDGNDALFGQRGNDHLDGEAGHDLLSGGAGHDEAYGGSGDDTVVGDELHLDSAAAAAPNVSHGLLIEGTVVVPALRTVPGATPNAVASVLPQVFGYGAGSLLPAGDGGGPFLAYASVVTDFGRHLDQVRGNDVLGGGEGNDTLVGDDQVVFARELAFDAASMARAEALTRRLLDLSDDFSDLVHRQFALLDTHDHDDDDGILVVDNVFPVGADRLEGGAGNDVLIGDDNLLIEPAFTLPVGLAADFERFVEGVTDAGHELTHAVRDLGDLDRHLREVVVLVPHKKHFHERVEHHVDVVELGNDFIAGGDGHDLIVGDAFVVRTPQVTLVAGGSTADYGKRDAWQDDDWKDKKGLDDLPRKHDHHDDDDEDDDEHARANIKTGADVILGGSGDDLVWGDNLALVTSSIERGAGVSGPDFDEARGPVKHALKAFTQLTATAEHSRFDNGDDISGGEGDDILFGQGGDDTLRGDAGDDWLVGGHGKDALDGGTGKDKLKKGSDESKGLRSAVGSRLVQWDDSFKNYGLPFSPFAGLTLGKGHGHSNFTSFDFVSRQRPESDDD